MSLGWNELNESLPVSFGQLSELVELDVSGNHLTGILSEQHFSDLNKLKILWVQENWDMVLNVSSTWIPPFQISDLNMDSCNLGPSFPTWLKSQKNVFFLGMSNASISGFIPNWFWNISSSIQEIYLSFNNLEGRLPTQLNLYSRAFIDFSFNLFEGPIPLPNHGSNLLDLSNNKFSGPIPVQIGESMPDLWSLSLSGNQLTGIIPHSIGFMSSLQIIDFSRNSLVASIPSSISNCSYLTFLSLGENNLSGTIPKSFGQLHWLQSIHLSNNHLSGEIPSSFQNLWNLEILDLSDNKFSGNIPAWIGAALGNLRILSLRSNSFSGELPNNLSNLSSLHILDLAKNNLSGSISISFHAFKAMTQWRNMSRYLYRVFEMRRPHEDSMIVNTKGQDLEYIKALSLIISIDLSSNNLSGDFPKEITNLFGLMSLNLSKNHIHGSIPNNISRLPELSSLDLSSNNLHGKIPSSMSSLTFLSYLNLSNNNFSGQIPFTGQMTTFSEYAFAGNPGLCGAPLITKCQDDDSSEGKIIVDDERNDEFIDQWFYLSIGLGFAAGILVPFFVLVLKKSWCEAYFSFVDKIIEKMPWLRIRAAGGRKYRRR